MFGWFNFFKKFISREILSKSSLSCILSFSNIFIATCSSVGM